MTNEESYKIEIDHPDITIIDSKASGLKYLFDEDRSRFAIAGDKGFTILSIQQAKALRDELSDIIEMRAYFTGR